MMQISKSDYMMFLRHPAWLWIKKHDPKQLPPVDAATQAIFDTGHNFEQYAEALFPGGVTVGFGDDYRTMPQRTTEVLESGAKVIFQGRFEFERLTFICDIVVVTGEKKLDLYEIKSSSSAKTDHQHDLAFQTIVLEGLGYTVNKIAVIHVNTKYVRRGPITPQDITATTEITDKVRKRIHATKEHIQKALKTVDAISMPDPSPSKCGLGSTADWLVIYKTLNGITAGNGSIYDIYSPSATLIGKLETAKLTKLADIPEDFAGLSDKQRWQIKALKAEKVLINHKELKDFMSKIQYPIYFLDYETMSSLEPYFDGHRPYQDVPFQYSLHVIESPGAEVKHFGYLHTIKTEPALPLSESLSKHIGPTGSVLVWWESFEKGRNEEMGEMLPQFKKFYQDVNDRVVDLITPFYDFYYVDKRFGGSASIKEVLPVLVPQLSYKELGIQEGRAAQRIWMETILKNKHPKEKVKILSDLIEYCKLDTLAMVEIYMKLCGIIEV